MTSPSDILLQYWGHANFRPLQEEIIADIIQGKDVLALLPTGGGKSVCFQIPALLLDGVCIVISPLIALMQDQVHQLEQKGIPAACIYAGMHYKEVKEVLEKAQREEIKLLYISPERIKTYQFNDYAYGIPVSMIAIDEAHCVSQWGYDFRPDYLKISELREIYSDVPMIALTASATPDMQSDILSKLSMKNVTVYKYSFSRNNLFYDIRYTEVKSSELVGSIVDGSAIVYTRSRKNAERAAEQLRHTGIKACVYHAGLEKNKRREAQKQWLTNESNVICATTAFGMGIDKLDVRLVLHYDAPEQMESWYQEAGRAGRDGKASTVITLFNETDITRLRASIAINFPEIDYLRSVYQSVVEYLQIPIGTEPYEYYSFDISDFCQKFSYKLAEVLPALKLLEREGLWTLSETVSFPSLIEFVAERHVVDELVAAHNELGYVAVGLLRQFSSIYYYPTHIREYVLAKHFKMSADRLIHCLEQLHQLGIINYKKSSEGPQLFFHHYRVDSNYLIIDTRKILLLKSRYEDRIEKMIAFLKNNTICRERILLEYFGETVDGNCGHCDVCKARDIEPLEYKSFKEIVLKKLEITTHTIQDIVQLFPQEYKKDVLAKIRQMVDEEVILLDHSGVLYLP